MVWSARLLALVLWAVSTMAMAQVPNLGSPIITNYEPQQYKAHNQNWVAVQDPRGVIYVGNSAGILEFDGRDWQLIPTPGGTAARAMASGPNGIIYYGSVGDFGYLEASPSGKVAAVSLVDALPPAERAFNDVLHVECTGDGIYFLTRTKIFRLHDGSISVITGQVSASPTCVLHDTLFFVDNEKGLSCVRGNEVVPIPALAGVYNEKRITLAPYREHELLVARQSGDFLRIDLSALWDAQTHRYEPKRSTSHAIIHAFPTEVDALLKDSQAVLYKLVPLGPDAFAISTLKAGIFIVDRSGKLLRVINKTSGLLDNTVPSLLVDRMHNLWASTLAGISHIEWSVPQSRFGARNGVDGITICARSYQGKMYVGTIQKLLVQAPYTYSLKNEVPIFIAIKNSPSQVFSLMDVHGDLLAACSEGLFQIKNEEAFLIPGSSLNNMCMGLISSWPDHLFVGSVQGVDVFKRSSGQWVLVGRMKGIKDGIRRIESNDGDLWLSTDAKGLIRAKFSGTSPTEVKLRRLGAEHGLPKPTAFFRAVVHDHQLFVLTRQGVFRGRVQPWDGQGADTTQFTIDPDFGKWFNNPPTPLQDMVADGRGGFFFIASTGVTWVVPAKGGGYRIEPGPFQGLESQGETAYVQPQGGVWLTGMGLYRVDPWVAKPYDQGFTVLIRKVATEAKRVLFEGAHHREGSPHGRPTPFVSTQGKDDPPQVPYRENALTFEFSATFFEKPGTTQFQYLLEGFDKEWSDWGTQTSKGYTNIPPGRFCFRVRARNLYGTLGQEAHYRFEILAPWYRTLWAYLLWTTLGGLVLVGIILLYTRKLRRQKLVLEALVAKRTEELRLAKDLAERARDEAERANAFKSTFLATTTHELRTPLNAILGFSRMLVQTDVRETERQGFIKTIWGAAESLLQLVNDLLDLNKIEVGKIEVERIPVNLRQILEESLILMGHRAQERNLLLLSEVDPEVPDQMLGDPLRIRQMLVNLIGNAVKFTPKGFVRVRMTLQEGPQVRVEVEDSGKGIPADILPRLFQAFSQAETAEKNQGTGLGLSITRHLAGLMGGETGVSSTLGKGSTFWFSLPISEPHNLERPTPWTGRRFATRIQNAMLAASLASHAQRLGASLATDSNLDICFVEHGSDLPEGFMGQGILVIRPGETPPRNASQRILSLPFGEPAFLRMAQSDLAPQEITITEPLRSDVPLDGNILLADDNYANRLLAKAILQQLGLNFTLVEDGLQAVEAFQSEVYDLVILDANMPNMGGLEAMKSIRSLPRGSHIPILICTASTSTEMRDQYLAEGFDDYLLKPADLEDFRRSVVQRIKRDSLSSPSVDPEALARLLGALGDSDAIRDYLEQYRAEGEQSIEEMNQALERQDRLEAGLQLAKLQTGAENLGLTNLLQALRPMPQVILDAPLDALLSQTRTLSRVFHAACDRAAAFLASPPADWPRPTFRSGLDPSRLERLSQVMGGPTQLLAFARELVEDCRARVQCLDAAIPALDRVQIQRQAHDLKSNAGNLGLQVLVQAAARMEKEASTAGPDQLALLHRELLEAFQNAVKDVENHFRGKN